MLKQAVEVVIDAGQASTSLLQRRCKLGYDPRRPHHWTRWKKRASSAPTRAQRPRAVLISRQQWLEMQMNQPDE